MESVLFFPIFNLSNQSPILDLLMKFGAVYLIYLSIALTALISLTAPNSNPNKKALIFLLLGLGISLIIIELIRLIYYEPRPFVTYQISPLIGFTTEASFPSKHTTIMAVLAFTYYHYKSKLASFLIISLFWVGFSRVFVGVHYPIDIIGGVLVGYLSFKLALKLKSHLRKYLA